MLNVESQRQKGEGILTQLPIELCHVEKEGFFITQVKVVLNTIVYSELAIMVGPVLVITWIKRLKVVNQFIFPP